MEAHRIPFFIIVNGLDCAGRTNVAKKIQEQLRCVRITCPGQSMFRYMLDLIVTWHTYTHGSMHRALAIRMPKYIIVEGEWLLDNEFMLNMADYIVHVTNPDKEINYIREIVRARLTATGKTPNESDTFTLYLDLARDFSSALVTYREIANHAVRESEFSSFMAQLLGGEIRSAHR